MAGPGAPPPSATFWVTTYSYDGNGSRISKAPDEEPATTFAWDARERMLSVTEGKTELQSNRYDLYNRRTVLTEGQQTTAFLYDGARVSNQYLVEAPIKGNGTSIRRLWLGGQLVGGVMGREGTYLMADALGSVGAVTNTAGTVLQRSFFKPFGEVRAEGAQLPLADGSAFVGGHGVLQDATTRLEYPDGRTETVLNVPRYDFNWQMTYDFAKPTRIP